MAMEIYVECPYNVFMSFAAFGMNLSGTNYLCDGILSISVTAYCPSGAVAGEGTYDLPSPIRGRADACLQLESHVGNGFSIGQATF